MRPRAPLAAGAALALSWSLAGCGQTRNSADVTPVKPPAASAPALPSAGAGGTAQLGAPGSATPSSTGRSPAAAVATGGRASGTQLSTGTGAAAGQSSGAASVTGGASVTPSGAIACTASHLTAAVIGSQGATGHGEIGISLQNSGTAPCRTYGFPGVAFLDAAGNPLHTTVLRGTSDFFGSSPEEHLLLAPGEEISFRMAVDHAAGGGAGCATAAEVSVIPPDDTVALRAVLPGGAYVCGAAEVSPVRAGTSAYP